MYYCVKSSARDAQVATSFGKPVKNLRGFVAQDIAKKDVTNPFITKMANQSNRPVVSPKGIMAAACFSAPTSHREPGATASQTQVAQPEDGENVILAYEALDSREQVLERHYKLKQTGAHKLGKHYTEMAQRSENHNRCKLNLIKTMQKSKFMWNGNLEVNTVAKHKIILSPPCALSIYSALCQPGRKQQEVKREEVSRMKKAGVSGAAVDLCASLMLSVFRKEGCHRFV